MLSRRAALRLLPDGPGDRLAGLSDDHGTSAGFPASEAFYVRRSAGHGTPDIQEHLLRRTIALSATLLILGTLTACGDAGTGESRKDAAKGSTSTGDFCSAFQRLIKLADDASLSDVKDAWKQFESSGTPDEMPETAHQGWQVMIDHIRDAKSANDLEVENPGKDIMSKVNAFQGYVTKTCHLDD